VSVFVAGLFRLRVLFETPGGDLRNHGAVHPTGAYLGPEFQFQNTIVHFNLPKLGRCRAKQIGFGMQGFEVTANRDTLANVFPIVGFEYWQLAAGVHAQKVRRFVFTAAHIDLLVFHIDAFLGNEDTYASRVWSYGDIKEFQEFGNPGLWF